MTRLPAIFVTHGSPTLPLDKGPAYDFLFGLGKCIARPKAILCISAHWEAPSPTVSTAAHPETIHDFYGFPPALYQITYPAPGAPRLAIEAGQLIENAGLECRYDDSRGLDHGAWCPLKLIYPEADIPVAQISVQSARGPAHHVELGRALAPLSGNGVLILASGSATHNLREFRGASIDTPPLGYVTAFDDWLVKTVTAGHWDDLLEYRRKAPEAQRNHPTEEHFLPLFVALGAGGLDPEARLLHRSYTYGFLAMTAFSFGERGEA